MTKNGNRLEFKWLQVRHQSPFPIGGLDRKVGVEQCCHKGRFWMKITVRTSVDVHSHPHLPRGRVLPSAHAIKIRPRGRWGASAWTRCCVRADAPPRPRRHGRPRGREKFYFFLFLFLFFIFFGSCCQLGKRKIYNLQFSVFSFQSPKSPSSAGFTGEAARRRRFFRPSSPSHPSKLYSSLGWLNSKVPKPFPPFSLRLIHVDGF
jgi:hypothetical protein